MGVPAVSVMFVGMILVGVCAGILVGVCYQQSHLADHTLMTGKLQEPQVVQGDPSVQVCQHDLSHPFDQDVHQMLFQVAHADL